MRAEKIRSAAVTADGGEVYIPLSEQPPELKRFGQDQKSAPPAQQHHASQQQCANPADPPAFTAW
ncbi:MAG: hypothetical protein U0401_14700 [Anaerolineae bacterium]